MYWGDGKGKTSAALGLGLRAVGNGLSVHLAQFLKGGERKSGELLALDGIEGFSYERFGVAGWVQENLAAHEEAAREGIEAAREEISEGIYDVFILDEVLYAVSMGLLSEGDVLDTLEEKDPDIELVLTGSHEELPRVEEASDLVTEMKSVKHPAEGDFLNRRGIDY